MNAHIPSLRRVRAGTKCGRWLARLFLALAAAVSPALAHGPDLSTGELKLSSTSLEARVTFPRKQIELILPFDQNHDGDVSPEEYAAMQQLLDAMAAHVFAVTADGRVVSPSQIRAVADAENNVHFEASYRFPSVRQLVIRSALIKKMPACHRQFLALVDIDGHPITEKLLNPSQDTLQASLATASATTSNVGRLRRPVAWVGLFAFAGVCGMLFVCRARVGLQVRRI